MAFDLTQNAFESLRDDSFENWLTLVDKQFIDITGMDRDSFPDQDYYDMWEADFTPEEAIAVAIYNEYGDYGLETFSLYNPY